MRFDSLANGDRLLIQPRGKAKGSAGDPSASKPLELTIVAPRGQAVSLVSTAARWATITRIQPMEQAYTPNDQLTPFAGDISLNAEDEAALHRFLGVYKNSYTAYRGYRKDCERFLLWVAHKLNGAQLADLTREDFLHYQAFLRDPDPTWCAPRARRNLSDGTPNPLWRPFEGPLSPASISAEFQILDIFVSWLVVEGYLPHNAIPISRQHASPGKGSNTRLDRSRREPRRSLSITETELRSVIAAVELYPQDTPHEVYDYERTRYLICLIYYLGLPLELVNKGTMGDFLNKNGKWFIAVRHWQNDEHLVAVHPHMLASLKRFRQFLGITPLPSPDEPIPIFPKRNLEASLDTRSLFGIIKKAFRHAAAMIEDKDSAVALRLQTASPLWIRNTAMKNYRRTEEFLRSPMHHPMIKLF